MNAFYLLIVGFLGLLAIFDLFVGVSDDAVNFLNSAIGSKAAKFKTVLIVAAFGVLLGAITSNGMMDVARHGVLQPDHFVFKEVMVVFLAVMVSDVIVLNVFNQMGLPTSTTVSMVFELIGATFCLSCIKISHDNTLTMGELLNASRSLQMILAIFFSVLVAFIIGFLVQWISRLAFTFNYKKHEKYCIAIFGGLAITVMLFFIFIQGLKSSTLISPEAHAWVNEHMGMLFGVIFVVSAVLSEVLYLLKVPVLKGIVLFGTFSLAMAFAGNDLVNFIGVPLAGLSSYQDYAANGAGQPDSFVMTSLMGSAQSPFFFLFGAAVIMIIAMATSKSARNVIKTSVDLSAQGEGDELFGSSAAARGIVRTSQQVSDFVGKYTSKKAKRWIDSRFDTSEITLEEGAAFDTVRASVNLIFAAILIMIGTTHKLPLSTTYVTFMLAMGTSLADRAWGRENAVFRITGVLSVVGGWLITALVAFTFTAIVALIMYYGGFVAQSLFILLVVYLLVRSAKKNKEKKDQPGSETFRMILRSNDPVTAWTLLCSHVRETQSSVTDFVIGQYTAILKGLTTQSSGMLGRVEHALDDEQQEIARLRRQEIISLRYVPEDLAMERNTWYHLSINSATQYIYCLKRMLEPVKIHVDNNFNPLPDEYKEEFRPIYEKVVDLLQRTHDYIASDKYAGYRDVMALGDDLKDELSELRKKHIDRMQQDRNSGNYKVSVVYLNLIQETQMLLSNMRHQLRSTKKFMEDRI